jgi:hypothetical protein
MNVMITTLGETMAVQNLPPDAIGDWELRREVCERDSGGDAQRWWRRRKTGGVEGGNVERGRERPARSERESKRAREQERERE